MKFERIMNMSRKELLKGMTRVGEANISIISLFGKRSIMRVVYKDKNGEYYCIYRSRLVPVIDGTKGE